MALRIRKFFVIDNYKQRVNSFKKKLKINRLEKLEFTLCDLTKIWEFNSNLNLNLNISQDFGYTVFGTKINLEEIEWHTDKFSGFVFPLERIDELKIERWFNKGIEIKFPWELSRFYFGVNLGQKYLITKDELYYRLFKKLILDWIKKNPFLYGVNWFSTMEVAIRSINWITSINYFFELIQNDEDFKDSISHSLLQHAEYIFSFPEIYSNGLTTNHTTAGYSGLLFLALTFDKHKKSNEWLTEAKAGLSQCIESQVYEDGVDFEGSIPYHRLVLELFAYSALAALARGIKFNTEYFQKLFKMFEYTAAYMDESGNAPQVGDNDSGRIIIFNDINNNPYLTEHDHSYLLMLGECIFDYQFKSQCTKRDNIIQNSFRLNEKIRVSDLNVSPRITDNSISFRSGGSHFLKNKNFALFVSCFPIGQNGKGGHNHLDMGSFTLSLRGKPIVVDPGTFTYTANKNVRDKFRSYSYHNTLYSYADDEIDWKENDYWSLKNYYRYKIEKFTSNALNVEINFDLDKIIRRRQFQIESNSLMIHDYYSGNFFSRINLHPDAKIMRR